MADEEKTKQAFTEAYEAGGKMIPNGMLNSAAMDDWHAKEGLGIGPDNTGHKTIESGDIQCSVDVKASFVHSSLATVDVACEKDGVALKNNLSGAEQDASIETGMKNQPIGYRGNGANYSVPSGRK